MDHLPRPGARVARQVDGETVWSGDGHSFKVPYLHDPGLAYDGSRFMDFSQQKVEEIENNLDKVAPYLQAWLYFGMIKEIFGHICGIDFDWHDFIKEAEEKGGEGKGEGKGGCATITTKKIDTLIYLWHAREADALAEEKFERLDRIEQVLAHADRVSFVMRNMPEPITAETNLDDPAAPGFPTLAAVLLSIKLLGMTICEAIATVYGDFLPKEGAEKEPRFTLDKTTHLKRHLNNIEFRSSYESDPIISQLLERAGYCPYQVEFCDREYLSQGNLGLRWYLTFLNRWGIPGDHDNCTTEACVGYQVDEANYKTQHFFARECDCETISLSEGDANLILECCRKGGTPLIRVDWPFLHIYQMGVDEGPTPPYVAISHVWSEGMGNPKENALPRCQMSILQFSASQSCPDKEDLYFWIDTLCIPAGREEERKQQIKKMADIYSGAEKVVVLDRSLMEAPSNTYREETLIRIWRSPWASRLWTLQEGRLSKSLSFFFADKFLELKHVGIENALYWQDAIYYQTDLPNWTSRYEELRDPVCYRMIECGAKFEDPDSIKAWEQVQLLPPVLVDGKDSNESKSTADSATHEIPPLPPSFISRINEYNRARSVRSMANNAFQSIGSLPPRHTYSSDRTPAELFRLMLTTLTMRSLTRPEDETVCLATTLGLDLEPILREGSPDERMRLFLTAIGTLPLGILFVDTERMRDKGRRWMPRTLLRRGARDVQGSCECQPDDRLLYQGMILKSKTSFAINRERSYFTVETADGSRYFVGIPPQPGLEIDPGERTYLVIPSRPPLTLDRIPQRVVVLSIVGDENSAWHLAASPDDSPMQTRYEFTAWLFELFRPGDTVTTDLGGPYGEYYIWQPPKKHSWRMDDEDLVAKPFDSLDEKTKVLIG